MGALLFLLRDGTTDFQRHPVTVLDHVGYLRHRLSKCNDHESLGDSIRP